MPDRDDNDDMMTRSFPADRSPLAGAGGGRDADAQTEKLGGLSGGPDHSRSAFASDPGESFPPGTMLASRYRVVAKLGAGGMGAVYRADDLTLNQPVALKFLPPEFAGDPRRIDRLRQEVRVGRDVSHPAVCRIYDIGEHPTPGGPRHFITMEYIDGEDLGSLLRRIGALPREKALQIVRQVCAGLAAAHERGVLHRDLKPANIMLDGRGNARISDFGLASVGHRITGNEAASGTPLYMAPEQLRGEEATARSDIYSLGLVMFEFFTGARPHNAETFEEIKLVRTSNVASTEAVLDHPDLDPLIARVVARCLDPVPARRPPSALAVAAALPGGDPLAAALAAGETPSPDMVAESGGVGRLRPAVAALMLLLCIVLPIGGSMWASQFAVSTYQPLDTPPVVMAYKAEEIIKQLGLNQEWAQTSRGYGRIVSRMNWARAQNDPALFDRALRDATPPYVFFWYRASPLPWAEPADAGFFRGPVGTSRPPMGIDGEIYISLDLKGRVRRLLVEQPEIVPAPDPSSLAPSSEIDESLLLRLCGLEGANMRPAEPRTLFAARTDRILAWEGVWPEEPLIPVRVEAGFTDGRISYLASFSPWELDAMSPVAVPADEAPMDPTDARVKRVVKALGAVLGSSLFVAVLVLIFVGAWLSRRNLRSGRGDIRGAVRFGWFTGIMMLIARWTVASELVPRTRFDVLDILAWGTLMALGSWSAYLAIEPIVRRRWPSTLIAWTRLLAGRPLDPLVGRNVLLGTTLGVVGWCGYRVAYLLPIVGSPDAHAHFAFNTAPSWVNIGAIATVVSLQSMMGLLFILLLVGVRRSVKATWLAVALMVLVLFIFDSSRVVNVDPDASTWSIAARRALAWSWSLAVCATLVTLYARVGVLAAIAFVVTENTAQLIPALGDWTAWHAWNAVAPAAFIMLLALWGAGAASFGRPANDALLDAGSSSRVRPRSA